MGAVEQSIKDHILSVYLEERIPVNSRFRPL